MKKPNQSTELMSSEKLLTEPVLDCEGSVLLAVVFNDMTVKQKLDVAADVAKQIEKFMYLNGYRFIFNKWYLQRPPSENETACESVTVKKTDEAAGLLAELFNRLSLKQKRYIEVTCGPQLEVYMDEHGYWLAFDNQYRYTPGTPMPPIKTPKKDET